jgi:cyclopropane-fatty-acyl-phospholipid synthase
VNTQAIDLVLDSGASATAIQHHYDVGNSFYALWLDRSMTYSSALWLDDGEDLEAAQRNKQNWHIDRSGIEPGGRLLDVGCGWGALMQCAVTQYPQSHCVGLTLSREQADHVGALNDPRIEVRLESWADHTPEHRYRGIISVGAFEHFARLEQSEESKVANYRRFFEFCADSLERGGRLSLQTITYENSDRHQFSSFFATEIFPESDLPHLSEICRAARGVFEIVELRNDRQHYAKTLRHWRKRLQRNKERAIQLVGEAKYRDYDKYLGLMIVAFHTGAMNLCRLAMRRIPSTAVLPGEGR